MKDNNTTSNTTNNTTMENVNMNWVNLLKYQYLWILEWYDAHPELRRNAKEKKLYKALLDTKSVMDFRVWQKMVKTWPDFVKAIRCLDYPIPMAQVFFSSVKWRTMGILRHAGHCCCLACPHIQNSQSFPLST